MVERNSEVVSIEAGEVGRAKSCKALWAPVRVFITLLKAKGI